MAEDPLAQQRRPVVAFDDAEADLLSLRRALTRIAPDGELHAYASERKLFEHLTALKRGPEHRLPAYVLLDINLPDRSGIDVLVDLKRDFPALPVVMLSGSAQPLDKHRAYCEGASGFVTKPLGLDALTQVITTIDAYWQTAVVLPGRLSP